VAAWTGGIDAERVDTAASLAWWQHPAQDAPTTAEDVDLSEPAEVDTAIAETVRADAGGAAAA
jgi:hypothetical protein